MNLIRMSLHLYVLNSTEVSGNHKYSAPVKILAALI